MLIEHLLYARDVWLRTKKKRGPDPQKHKFSLEQESR